METGNKSNSCHHVNEAPPPRVKRGVINREGYDDVDFDE